MIDCNGICLLSIPIILILAFALHRHYRGYIMKGERPNLQGKVALITGGNTGIGKQVAISLAKQNCRVIIGARDTQKSQKVVTQIATSLKKQLVQYHHLDLADLQSIKTFVNNIKYQKIDYLINNAAVFCIPQRQLTKSGFQMQYGINYVGHFYLTYLLWPKLKSSQFVRIINVSALAHNSEISKFRVPTLDLNDVNFQKTKYTPQLAYSRSKICNNLFTHALAQKINNNKGISVSLHPGVVRTELSRYLPTIFQIIKLIFYPLMLIFFKSAQQGAQTILAMIFLPPASLKNGAYYSDAKIDKQNICVNKENWDKLWNISQRDLNIKFDCQ